MPCCKTDLAPDEFEFDSAAEVSKLLGEFSRLTAERTFCRTTTQNDLTRRRVYARYAALIKGMDSKDLVALPIFEMLKTVVTSRGYEFDILQIPYLEAIVKNFPGTNRARKFQAKLQLMQKNNPDVFVLSSNWAVPFRKCEDILHSF